jgi:YidC/Oxa1 family membrane protein insertase
VFIALFWVLQASVEMRGAPWLGWIHDLTAPDPYFILPVLYAISMFITSKLNPQPADPVQAKMMLFMPLAFSAMFIFFPAGLVLYWVVNNVLSIGQQWAITKKFAPKK